MDIHKENPDDPNNQQVSVICTVLILLKSSFCSLLWLCVSVGETELESFVHNLKALFLPLNIQMCIISVVSLVKDHAGYSDGFLLIYNNSIYKP
jgi:hypothetical protein